MRTALALFEGVQHEINKFKVATFDVAAFNHWIMRAVNKWVLECYREYERTQQLSDHLRTILEQDTKQFNDASTNPALYEVDLEANYRHMLNAQVVFLVKQAFRNHAVNSTFAKRAERQTSTTKTYAEDNYYLQPSVDRPYWRVVGGKLQIEYDTLDKPNAKVVVKEVHYEYLRTPDPITLAADYSGTASTWPDEVDDILVLLCAQLYLNSVGISQPQSQS